MSKVIVVVGASRGIGKELVLNFAQNSEDKIIALARSFQNMKSNFVGLKNVDCFEVDLTSTSLRLEIERLFHSITKIDVLINNAGSLVNKPFSEITHDDFTTSYQINVIGVMETVQALLPKLSTAHIVNISSMGGFQGSLKFAGLTAYSTSKAALCSFTELFAEEYKETDIKMNCLCLGAVQTEMLEEAFPGYIAPHSAAKMAEFICDFALNSHQWMNGKIIPVSTSNP
jgi:short-subunit dehydrogenase